MADLLDAIDGLDSYISLTIVGRKFQTNCTPLNKALKKHKWIPSLSHEKVIQIMGQHDILVFPSLFEGFGLVITEAMSQGTPVITTERTAGPDLIVHGENGWLFKAGYPQDLRALLEEILLNPEHISDFGRAAQETAKKRTWEVYQKELCEAILKNDENRKKI